MKAISPRAWVQSIHAFDLVLVGWGIILALALAASGLLEGLEARTYDFRLRASARLRPVPRGTSAVLLPIDDLAVARFGRWPWPRSRWSPILEGLADLGARAAFFDIEFAEPSDPTVPGDASGRSFRTMLEEEFPQIEGFLAPDKIGATASSDAARKDPRAAMVALGEGLLGQIERLRESVTRSVHDPDRDMAYTFAQCRARGCPVLGVGYIVAGQTAAQEEEQVDLDAYVRSLVESEPPRASAQSGQANAMGGERSGQVSGQVRGQVGGADKDKERGAGRARDRSGDRSGDRRGDTERVGDGESEDRNAPDRKTNDKPPEEPADSRRLERTMLRVLKENLLAGADDPRFARAGLERAKVDETLVTARETLVSAALDRCLQDEPGLSDAALLDRAAQRLGLSGGGALAPLAARLVMPARARACVLGRFAFPNPDSRAPGMGVFESIVPPILDLAQTYAGVAVSTVSPDADGTNRRVPLLWPVRTGLIPSPTLLLFCVEHGVLGRRHDGTAIVRQAGGDRLVLSLPDGVTRTVPLDGHGNMLLRFAGTYADDLAKVPLAAVCGWLSLKAEREDYFARKAYPAGEYRRALKILAAARTAATTPEREISFDALAGQMRASGAWESEMTPQDVLDPASADLSPVSTAASGAMPVTPFAPAPPPGPIAPAAQVAPLSHGVGRTVMSPGGPLPAPSPTPSPNGPWLTAREWERQARARVDDLESSRIRLVLAQVEKFERLPREKQEEKLARAGSQWPEYLDAARMFRAREMEHLGERLHEALAGKMAIIGTAQTGNTDVGPTPLEAQKVPNFALHVHGLSTLESGAFLTRPHYAVATLVPTAAACLTIGLVLPAVGILTGLIWTVGIALLLCALTTALLIHGGVWLDLVAPVTGIVSTYTFISAYRYFKEERKKQEIRLMLEAYLDPRAVQRFIDHKELWHELGGAACEITAFFSDIEGFTGISEILPPEELAAMLTDYLTPMTQAIQAHEGLRDKFIGDAIVAIFGAPLHMPDHSIKACLACIAQSEALARLLADPALLANPRSWLSMLKARGKSLRVRMGLNTGIAKVGNFGSLTNRQYTMIGDTVNLASRLEGANKAFGTSVMISESTYAQARNDVETRALDRLVVKGKLIPVTVYELLGARGKTPDLLLEVRERFDAGRRLYLEQRFEEARVVFEACLQLRPEDAPSATYVERCQELAAHPPGKEWDGVYHLKEK